jgi:RNA polymerase sigma-19 factor, ECF subfamily
METNEKLLLQELSKGNKKAFETIFNTYYQQLVVFAKKYIIDLDLSRDIVQEIFIKFYENSNDLRITTSLKSYLFQSTRNACLNKIEQKKIHAQHHENIQYLKKDETDLADKLEETEFEYRIYKAINNLPEQCAKIFKMNRLEGKRNQEIADELNISKRTVETQISKALKILRTDLIDVFIILIIIILNQNNLFF